MRRITFAALTLFFVACATGSKSSSGGVATTTPPANSGIKVASPEAPAAPTFSSEYTDLNTECKAAFKEEELSEGQDMPLRCKGYGGYYIDIGYTAWSSGIGVLRDDDKNFVLALAEQSLGYSDEKGRKVEWRMADGKPFAVILRVTSYNKDKAGETADNPYQEKYKNGEALVVKGLKGYEHIYAAVDTKTPDANVKAREAADSGYAKK